jgi:Flp pilus assembly CpaF family ATPase
MTETRPPDLVDLPLLRSSTGPKPPQTSEAGAASRGPGAHLVGLPLLSDASGPPAAPPGLSLQELSTWVAGSPWQQQDRGQPAPEVDWSLVATLRQAAAKELSAVLDARVDPAAERAMGAEVVARLLRQLADTDQVAGVAAQDRAGRDRLHRAVMDSLFGLGRLQPLVDDPQIENVELYGARRTVLCYADGRVEPGPPVADSDLELTEMLAWIASRQRGSQRAFSPAHPRLHLRLDNGARLAAIGWVSAEPVAVIRLHRLVSVTLADLVARSMMSPEVADFLARAVRAGKSIVVSGPQGGGKTTLVRALARELPAHVSVVTIETEYELHLAEAMPDRRIKALEARPGSGERGLNGRAAGEITVADLVEDVWRLNAGRIIVGEVRGPEVLAMLNVMSGGAGSMSTVHADTARAAVERLITLSMAAGPQVTAEYARRQVAEHIDLIVQLGIHHQPTGEPDRHRMHRYISEVVALEHTGDGQAVTDLFTAGPDRVARRAHLPHHLAAELGLP